jgi:DNA helicase II / ATP-dependent DNA helicase PcrA
MQFATEVEAHCHSALSGNFRSSGSVVAHAERLIARQPAMAAVGKHKDEAIEPRHINANNVFDAITGYFLPSLTQHGIGYQDAAILAPTWFLLLPLGKALREHGVPVIGPGARPYKRDRPFARLAEHVCAFIERRQPSMIPRIERTLFDMVLDLGDTSRFDIFSYKGRLTIQRLIRVGSEQREKSAAGMAWLEECAKAFEDILIQDGFLSTASAALLSASVADMRADMEKNQIDIPNLSTEDLGLFAAPDASISLLTLHKSKGREFAAVALIGLHEGLIPRRSSNSEGIAEAKRLLYVGITRAERLLFYITDRSDSRNSPSSFLGQSGMKLKCDTV